MNLPARFYDLKEIPLAVASAYEFTLCKSCAGSGRAGDENGNETRGKCRGCNGWGSFYALIKEVRKDAAS